MSDRYFHYFMTGTFGDGYPNVETFVNMKNKKGLSLINGIGWSKILGNVYLVFHRFFFGSGVSVIAGVRRRVVQYQVQNTYDHNHQGNNNNSLFNGRLVFPAYSPRDRGLVFLAYGIYKRLLL